MACKVDERIASTLRVFLRTYGWVACGTIPAVWVEALERYVQRCVEQNLDLPLYYPTGPSLYVASEAGGVPLMQYVFLNIVEFKGFLFELFYSLYEAYSMERFTHGDLFIGNVLVHERNAKELPYIVGSENRRYMVEGPIHPTIIDFGKATFDDRSVTNMFDVRHFVRSLYSLYRRYDPPLVEFMKNILEPAVKKYTNLEDLLLDPMFDVLKVRQPDSRPTPVSRIECHYCRREGAAERIARAPSYAFCGVHCVARFGPIGLIVK
jgi:hypothetical protein